MAEPGPSARAFWDALVPHPAAPLRLSTLALETGALAPHPAAPLRLSTLALETGALAPPLRAKPPPPVRTPPPPSPRAMPPVRTPKAGGGGGHVKPKYAIRDALKAGGWVLNRVGKHEVYSRPPVELSDGRVLPKQVTSVACSPRNPSTFVFNVLAELRTFDAWRVLEERGE